MSITYPINIPATPGFRSIRWQPRSAVANQPSSFSYANKKYAFSGKLRQVDVELPVMDEATAKLWAAWAMQLNGTEGTFLLQDSLYTAPQGLVANSYSGGLVNGAAQVSSTLITDGWAVSQVGYFKAGDWLSIDQRLFQITVDADTDVGGAANLELWPSPIGYADNEPISVGSSAEGVFELMDWPDWGWNIDRYTDGFSFTAKEAL